MALQGLSLGDRQAFSLECLCLSDNSGEAKNRKQSNQNNIDTIRYSSDVCSCIQAIGKCSLYWFRKSIEIVLVIQY